MSTNIVRYRKHVNYLDFATLSSDRKKMHALPTSMSLLQILEYEIRLKKCMSWRQLRQESSIQHGMCSARHNHATCHVRYNVYAYTGPFCDFYYVSSCRCVVPSCGPCGMHTAPLAAGSLMGSTSSTRGCKPSNWPSFPTSITAGTDWLNSSRPRLPLTSVRHTIFHPGLVGSLEKNTCWQCIGNANELECTLPSMRLKFAIVKP